MYREKVNKVLFSLGLILLVTSLAISSWTYLPNSKVLYTVPGKGRAYEPNSIYMERQYGYFLDDTEILVTAQLPPHIRFEFNISKVGDQWRFSRNGAGHVSFTIKLPYRGVYEFSTTIWVGETEDELVGSIYTSISSSRVGEMYLTYSMYLILPGLVLIAISILRRNIYHVR
jgi:hypothetical protein